MTKTMYNSPENNKIRGLMNYLGGFLSIFFDFFMIIRNSTSLVLRLLKSIESLW